MYVGDFQVAGSAHPWVCRKRELLTRLVVRARGRDASTLSTAERVAGIVELVATDPTIVLPDVEPTASSAPLEPSL